ncbi:hypothetical protein KGF56_004293 [Candida oxycetoniae]|uniref:Ribosomal RNA-processing protein 1 n=1 Tax=Candida oxycetoniae TaxID=497107 RepID=A0AAI9STM8_9ASCO|nr:uncharacterized protein KGF56_004293 [Candida oxycetoniae]KAI3402832.2 hypothetical protein KGF56_004293 [Candida oxycetoniae]
MAAEGIEKLTEVPLEFFKDGNAFIRKCQKPDQREYLKIIRAVGIGFLMMGVLQEEFCSKLEEKFYSKLHDMSQTSAFVKKLASNNKTTRDAALESLRKYLASKTTLTLLDMEKIWRGLYFSMWFCDRPKAQERLAESLGQLYSESIKSKKAFLLFVKAFNLIMIKEWTDIDQWRIDKFYLLIRRVLRHNFIYMKKNDWNEKLVDSWIEVMEETILSGDSKVPVALPYHLCDIYLDELELVVFGEENIQVSADDIPIQKLIEPFTILNKSAKLKTLREKTKEDVLDDKRLVEWKVVENKISDTEDGEEEEWNGF